jgi:D-cysteine desulfhydrase family pyridoxal phosphate-dependent enzyme
VPAIKLAAGIPLVDFAARQTPLQPLERLGAELGLKRGQLWVKRDDLTGLAGGGNKARKLEYLVAEALNQGCDTLVTTGAAQSNHVRATAAAARVHGLRCVAVLSTLGKEHAAEGNLILDDLFDLEIVWTPPEQRDGTMRAVSDQLKQQGKRPYVIPLGGTSALGAVGYATAAAEIEQELPGATVICTVGTGGTQAGLTVGFGSHDRVIGFDVAALPNLAELVPAVISQTAQLIGCPAPVGSWSVDTSQAAAPYGAPTQAAREAIRLAATTSGLVLDPVYTGRTMAGFVRRSQDQSLPDTPLVFLHSGGLPALFTARYRDWFKLPQLLL